MTKASSKTVLLFGSFDPLHEGHRYCFGQAKALAEKLLVVVTSDVQIRAQKKHEPYMPEVERLATVQVEPEVDEALLGDEATGDYRLLKALDFEILAVGYDQRPDDSTIYEILRKTGKVNVQVVRLKPYRPEQYKSSLFRGNF